jgi:N-methylhydantoinase B/oxoprolinase/acetone carboxylase alpha subunit
MFIRGMAETVKAKIKHFGAGNMRPGDIYVTNDSYLTGSHLNHVTLTLPIFHKGRLVAFSCCMAHWLDIGGILGGMSTDIFSEGLQIPILKYQDRGVVNATVVDIIRQNVRLPSRAMGDLRAQVTAVKTGERRFLELIAIPCSGRSRRSWITPRPWRARARARFPTASTRRNRTWTTTASTSAARCRSACASWSRATR